MGITGKSTANNIKKAHGVDNVVLRRMLIDKERVSKI